MPRTGVFRRAARIGALFVLAWTATDLANPAICALDQEDLSVPVERSTGGPHPSGSDEDVHFDDCFCCSHCVEPTFVFHVDRSAADAGRLIPRRVRSPHKIHLRLYRPPQRTS